MPVVVHLSEEAHQRIAGALKARVNVLNGLRCPGSTVAPGIATASQARYEAAYQLAAADLAEFTGGRQ